MGKIAKKTLTLALGIIFSWVLLLTIVVVMIEGYKIFDHYHLTIISIIDLIKELINM